MRLGSNRSAALIAAALALAVFPATVAAGWSTPVRVSPRTLGTPALAVDGAGHRHLVARGGDGLWYITDRTGRWTERRLTRDGPEVEGERLLAHHPDVDIDPTDGSVVVAWVLSKPAGTGGCSGEVRYRTLRRGDWSVTRAVPTPTCAGSLDLEVRGGRITVAIAMRKLEYARIAVVAGRPGHWATSYLGDEPSGQDPFPMPFAEDPALELDASGHPSVAYEKGAWTGDATRTVVRWAHHIVGRPGLTSVPIRRYAGDQPELPAIDLVLDRAGRPRIAWVGPDGTWVATLKDGGWSSVRVTDPAQDLAIALDRAGRTVLALAMGPDGLVLFRRGPSGWSQTVVVDESHVATIAGLRRERDGDLHLGWLRGRPGQTTHTWVSRLG